MLLGGSEPTLVLQAAFYRPGSVGWQDVLGTSVYSVSRRWRTQACTFFPPQKSDTASRPDLDSTVHRSRPARQEQENAFELKHRRHIWLKNPLPALVATRTSEVALM